MPATRTRCTAYWAGFEQQAREQLMRLRLRGQSAEKQIGIAVLVDLVAALVPI